MIFPPNYLLIATAIFPILHLYYYLLHRILFHKKWNSFIVFKLLLIVMVQQYQVHLPDWDYFCYIFFLLIVSLFIAKLAFIEKLSHDLLRSLYFKSINCCFFELYCQQNYYCLIIETIILAFNFLMLDLFIFVKLIEFQAKNRK